MRARLSSVSRLICEGHNCGINTPRPAPAPGRCRAQVVLVQVRLRQSDKERVGREAGTGLAPGAAREGQGLQGGELRLPTAHRPLIGEPPHSLPLAHFRGGRCAHWPARQSRGSPQGLQLIT